MNEPLISVITPTWQRYDLLFERCIPSVQAQTYPNVEHIIVHDGPPEDGAGPIAARLQESYGYEVPIRFDYIEAHKPGGRTRSRQRALEMAQGELIGYCDDDDALRPHHLELLAAALRDNPLAGFAYSQMSSHDGTGAVFAVVGQDPPALTHIGSPMIVHRKGILQHGTWGPDRPDEDWQMVQRWLAHDIEYVYLPAITSDVWPSAFRGGR
jgi:glycosyltransferase involved in cell wall biosynthesis